MIGRPSGVSPKNRPSYTSGRYCIGVSEYMFISSMITPFSRSISSGSKREWKSMSARTSSACAVWSRVHLM